MFKSVKDNLIEISNGSKETNREGFNCSLYSGHPLMAGDISRSLLGIQLLFLFSPVTFTPLTKLVQIGQKFKRIWVFCVFCGVFQGGCFVFSMKVCQLVELLYSILFSKGGGRRMDGHPPPYSPKKNKPGKKYSLLLLMF